MCQVGLGQRFIELEMGQDASPQSTPHASPSLTSRHLVSDRRLALHPILGEYLRESWHCHSALNR